MVYILARHIRDSEISVLGPMETADAIIQIKHMTKEDEEYGDTSNWEYRMMDQKILWPNN